MNFRVYDNKRKQWFDDPKWWGQSEAAKRHLGNHLLIGGTGRVFWLEYDGLKEITDDVTVEFLDN